MLYRYGISISDDIEDGVVVISVEKNTGAAKSDLEKGDVIVAIDGKEVKNAANLKYILYKYKPGDKIKVKYNRDGKEIYQLILFVKEHIFLEQPYGRLKTEIQALL